jgi:V/A-type H+/Na+-transporting ATPase subunit E
MNDKLTELTNKLYKEGIEKAEQDALEITGNAKKQADDMIRQATRKAESILEDARKKTEELKKNTESELKLSARQAVNALKQSITDMVLTKSVKEPVAEVMNDKEFLKAMILKIADNFSKHEFDSTQMEVILPVKDREAFEQFFVSKQKELLDKGLTVKFSDAIESGFQLGPDDNKYKISFTEETFEAFFRNYLRERSIKLLYEE